MLDTLVIAAHPDDEILGCGGTVAKLSASQKIGFVILGEGLTSRRLSRNQTSSSDLDQLQKDAKTAAAAVGVGSVDFGNLPDNRFDNLPLLDIVKQIEELIEQYQPSTIYTHHPGDLNIDHTVTYRAVLTATRPMMGCPVKELYAFEVISSTEWAFQTLQPPFRPNVFVDISDTVEQKVKALEAYPSEIREFPHPRSAEGVRASARRWGSVIGVNFAEPFELIRSVIR